VGNAGWEAWQSFDMTFLSPTARILRHSTRPRPRDRNTSATFPQVEQRIRAASLANVTDLPAIRASVSGSMWREVPHGYETRTRKSPKQSSIFLTWGRARTRAWC
jgi:hypothetical protein